MLVRPAFDNGSIAARKYRVTEFLGEEGSLEIYRAEDPGTGQQVLLKHLASCDPDNEELARFIREVRTCCIIDSPHVTRTIAVEIEAPALTVVTEVPPGVKLRDMLERQSTLETGDALEIVSQCLCGLEAAHRLLICHRDLRPDNVYIQRTEDGIKVKIADFGIAGIRSTEPEKSVTGFFRGSPAYMPPEKIFRWPDIDRSSDMFSLGVMLFEMLTGRLPYGDNWRDAPTNALEERIVPHPDKPAGLWKIVKRAIHPLPSQRYPSTREMRLAIEQYTNQKGSILPSPRVRLLALGAALGASFGFALAWTSANTHHRASHPRNEPTHSVAPAPVPSAVAQDVPAVGTPVSTVARRDVPVAVAPVTSVIARDVSPAVPRIPTVAARGVPAAIPHVPTVAARDVLAAVPHDSALAARGAPAALAQERVVSKRTERSPTPLPIALAAQPTSPPRLATHDTPKPAPSPVARPASVTITVEVSAQLAEVDDLRILLDGIAQHRATWGVALPTELGIHQLQASAPGRRTWATTIRVDATKPHQKINIPVLQTQDSVDGSTTLGSANLATADIP